MTDLTGAELALAVARVMGLRDVYEEDETVWRGDGSVYRTEKFRPDQGGAAAWEVLLYAWERWGWAAVSDAIEQEIANDEASSPKELYACRAVVALGEAG